MTPLLHMQAACFLKLMTYESLDFPIRLIEANSCITLKELKTQLREVCPRKPQVLLSTISHALDEELITLKKADNIPDKRNFALVKELYEQHMRNG